MGHPVIRQKRSAQARAFDSADDGSRHGAFSVVMGRGEHRFKGIVIGQRAINAHRQGFFRFFARPQGVQAVHMIKGRPFPGRVIVRLRDGRGK